MKILTLIFGTLIALPAISQTDYLIRVRDPVFKSVVNVQEKTIPQVKVKPGQTIPFHLPSGQNILFVALTVDAPLDTTKKWIFELKAVEDTGVPPPTDVTEDVDDRDARIVYGPGWDKTCCTSDPNSPHHNSTISFHCTVGGTFTFTFVGKSVTWFAEKLKTHATVGVKFDTETLETVYDLYSPTQLTKQSIFTKAWPTVGEHKVTIRITGKNPLAVANCLVSDSFRIIK